MLWFPWGELVVPGSWDSRCARAPGAPLCPTPTPGHGAAQRAWSAQSLGTSSRQDMAFPAALVSLPGGEGGQRCASAGPHASHEHCWLQWTPRKFSGSWVVTLVLPQKDNLDLLWGVFARVFFVSDSPQLSSVPYRYILNSPYIYHSLWVSIFPFNGLKNVWLSHVTASSLSQGPCLSMLTFVVHQYRLD